MSLNLLKVWARECSDFEIYYTCTDGNWLQSIVKLDPLTKMDAVAVHSFLRSNLLILPDEFLPRFPLGRIWLSPAPFLRHLVAYFEKFDFLYPCDLTGIYADFRHADKNVGRDVLEDHFDLVSPHNIRTDISVLKSYQYERYALLFRDE